MRIEEVKTAQKIGYFILRQDNTPNRINIKYLSKISREILEDDAGRVYLFVVNREIKKIGGSSSKGGIKATMSFYVNAMQGSPGRPRFIIHLLIEKELKKGNEVTLYMITSPKVKAKVPGLFGYYEKEIASFKEMEELCKKDYFEKEGRYPDWNFQENGEDYPEILAKLHNLYHQIRLSKNRKEGECLSREFEKLHNEWLRDP